MQQLNKPPSDHRERCIEGVDNLHRVSRSALSIAKLLHYKALNGQLKSDDILDDLNDVMQALQIIDLVLDVFLPNDLVDFNSKQ